VASLGQQGTLQVADRRSPSSRTTPGAVRPRHQCPIPRRSLARRLWSG